MITSCKKQIAEEIPGVLEKKITICHYDKQTGTSQAIEVSKNELAAHLAHGDLEGDCSSVITTICDQVWMVKNLDVDHFRNGDPILKITSDDGWVSTFFNRKAAYCYYNNDSATYAASYGKLYNFYAILDPRGLAPVGWHVASKQDFIKLAVDCLGGAFIGDPGLLDWRNISIAGGKMKESGTSHWVSPNAGATNSSRFTGLPGGARGNSNGNFYDIGTRGTYGIGGDLGFDYCYQLYNLNDVLRFNWDLGQPTGVSVRCLRD